MRSSIFDFETEENEDTEDNEDEDEDAKETSVENKQSVVGQRSRNSAWIVLEALFFSCGNEKDISVDSDLIADNWFVQNVHYSGCNYR